MRDHVEIVSRLFLSSNFQFNDVHGLKEKKVNIADTGHCYDSRDQYSRFKHSACNTVTSNNTFKTKENDPHALTPRLKHSLEKRLIFEGLKSMSGMTGESLSPSTWHPISINARRK